MQPSTTAAPRGILAAVLVGVAVLSACAEGATPGETPTSTSPVAAPTMPVEGPTSPSPDDATPPHPVLAATATAPDGSTFTIGDHAGSTVFVETFATWCSKCRQQLADTNEAAARAGDEVVFLILSIEAGLDPAKLASYAADNGFTNLRFGVLDEAGLAAFNQEFGRSVLNAPSTPMFVVAGDGTLGELSTGFESPDEILARVA